MKYRYLLLSGVICFIIVIVSLWIHLGKTRMEQDRTTFSERICGNLVQASYLRENECAISTSIPFVFENTFPQGTPINYVLAGMEGFKKTTDVTSSINTCSNLREIRYEIIPGFLLSWDENIVFSFCENALFNISWEN